MFRRTRRDVYSTARTMLFSSTRQSTLVTLTSALWPPRHNAPLHGHCSVRVTSRLLLYVIYLFVLFSNLSYPIRLSQLRSGPSIQSTTTCRLCLTIHVHWLRDGVIRHLLETTYMRKARKNQNCIPPRELIEIKGLAEWWPTTIEVHSGYIFQLSIYFNAIQRSTAFNFCNAVCTNIFTKIPFGIYIYIYIYMQAW